MGVATSTSREVERVVQRTDADPERVRAALDPVADGERITTETVEGAVSDTAKLLTTAETRVELAAIAFDDATEATAGVDDCALVRERLAAFSARLDAVTERAAALGPALPKPDQEALGSAESLYELGLDLRDVATRAQGVIQTADDLAFDLEQFESWVGRPERRHEEFSEDAALVEESVTALADAVAAVEDDDEPGVAWAEVTMRARVLDLLVADLRAELDDLWTLAERQGARVPPEHEQRVAATAREVGRLRARLTDRAEPAWRERFAPELNALATELAEMEPPVDWGAVDAVLSSQRAALETKE